MKTRTFVSFLCTIGRVDSFSASGFVPKANNPRSSFNRQPFHPGLSISRDQNAVSSSSSSSSSSPKSIEPQPNKEGIDDEPAFVPVFDFANINDKAIEKFDRIDDAIMGGISLSSMKQFPNEQFARWSGICRTDGGGFCGTRTLPFEEPLQIAENAKGFYILCKFTSDDEPERRIWKMTTRQEKGSRGEQLYQAMFEMPKRKIIDDDDEDCWSRVFVPFSSFKLVRGPRLIEGGSPLNTTGGLFQIGMTLSKFEMSSTPKELENFRPGYFELQIREMGVYSENDGGKSNETTTVQAIKTLSKEESEKNRSFVAKMLFPVFKMLFSEKRRRRASALRILQKRGLSRSQAILFGLRRKASSNGKIIALCQTLCMLSGDVLRASIFFTLRLAIFYPLVALRKLINFLTGKKKSASAVK